MKILFWAVDCQQDFINPDGKLCVKGAEEIRPNLKRLTELANKVDGIQVVSTGDFHNKDSKEIANIPDFKTTWPEHCMEGSEGAEFIDETKPERGKYTTCVAPKKGVVSVQDISNAKNVVIFKDDFDVFKGNIWTGSVLQIINPDLVIVYGVASNICVNFAVLGILKNNFKVIVVKDAIKELPDLPVDELISNWESQGVELKTTNEIEEMITKK